MMKCVCIYYIYTYICRILVIIQIMISFEHTTKIKCYNEGSLGTKYGLGMFRVCSIVFYTNSLPEHFKDIGLGPSWA